ncbi:hypothetical protein OPV22_001308 [Ensete ventricosum]|uniref:Uncharacterized protein n=1 Tax=Ensete ventricosum TaxID=4639 RepID=A0AAV8RL10_ENSVE|nr:hypothetical protein OPV22_001308 [Ensete ventricosum]
MLFSGQGNKTYPFVTITPLSILARVGIAYSQLWYASEIQIAEFMKSNGHQIHYSVKECNTHYLYPKSTCLAKKRDQFTTKLISLAFMPPNRGEKQNEFHGSISARQKSDLESPTSS